MLKTLKNQIIMMFRRAYLYRRGVRIGFWSEMGRCKFKGTALIEPFCRFNGEPEITIGHNFYANAHCHFFGEIVIGDNVLIGPKVVIWARDHGIRLGQLINQQEHVSEKIVIGDDVWLGAGAIILKGVVIGDGAVVAAGCVVTRNVPSNSIVAGSPARVVKYRS